MRPLKTTLLLVAVIGVASWALFWVSRLNASADAPHEGSGEVTIAPAEAMHRLVDGNERFARQKMTAAHHDASRREAGKRDEKKRRIGRPPSEICSQFS